MLRKRKHFMGSIGLALVLLVLSVLTPQPVLAAEIKVNSEQKLRDAVKTATAGDVINVTSHITLNGSGIVVDHTDPFTITSSNHSVIKSSAAFCLGLGYDAKVTLAGNVCLESSDGSVVTGLQGFRFTLTDKAEINALGAMIGIACAAGSTVNVTGGSIRVTQTGAKRAVAILGEESQIGISGGDIHVSHTGTGSAAGLIVSEKCSVKISGGSIKVTHSGSTGNTAMNVGVASSGNSLSMTGGHISAEGKDCKTCGMLVSMECQLDIYGGSISGQGGQNAWGVVGSNSEIVIHDHPSNTTLISGDTAGIVLGASLADISISSRLTIKGGVREEKMRILGKLPEPIAMATGNMRSLQLESAHSLVSFLVDPATSSQLVAKAEKTKNTYTLYTADDGLYDLVLRAENIFDDNNTVILRIPVSATFLPFTDVASSHWALTYIKNLYNKTIIKGYPNGTFKPGNPLLREHAAKMIALGAKLDYQGKKANFPDVDSKGEMSPYIAALVEKGAIRGFPDGTFRPRQNIKRYQIAQIVAKAFDLEMGKLPASFPDLPAGEAGDYIKILASNGIVKGYPDGKFKPQGLVSRAEFCKILTIAMAVSGVQQAEFVASFTISGKDILTPAIAAAQELIDVLPDDQDLQTKQDLQARLDALK